MGYKLQNVVMVNHRTHVIDQSRQISRDIQMPSSESMLPDPCTLLHFQYLASLERKGERDRGQGTGERRDRRQGTREPYEEQSLSSVDYLIAAKSIQ